MRVRMEDLIRTVREAAPLFRDKERAAKIQVKGAADFVTQVDFQVQEYVKARLEALEPEIQFMGEEKDNGAIDFSRPAWILDPVEFHWRSGRTEMSGWAWCTSLIRTRCLPRCAAAGLF